MSLYGLSNGVTVKVLEGSFNVHGNEGSAGVLVAKHPQCFGEFARTITAPHTKLYAAYVAADR